MIHGIFEAILQSLGPSFDQVAEWMYWAGLALVGMAVLAPVARVGLEYMTARAGLERRWVMRCTHCGHRTVIKGAECTYCGESVGLSWVVRLWTDTRFGRESAVTQRLRWVLHIGAAGAFAFVAYRLMTAVGALEPEGRLHQLFAGISLIALAVVGWLGGRTFRLGSEGLLGRLRDGVMALAWTGFLGLALILADAARPTSEVLLARFSVDGHTARIGDRLVPVSNAEIEFEYVQLDHDLLGYHRIVSVAFLGDERVPFSQSGPGQWLVEHLRRNAMEYQDYGLFVRARRDRVPIASGEFYEVTQRDNQVLIRRAGEARPIAGTR